VDRNLAGLFQLYGRVANADPAISQIAFPRCIHPRRIEDRGRLSLIGAVVAEIAAGSAVPAPDWPIESPNPAIVSTFPECSQRCCMLSAPELSFMGCWR